MIQQFQKSYHIIFSSLRKVFILARNEDKCVPTLTQLSTKPHEGRLHIIKRPAEHYLNHLKLVFSFYRIG